VRRIAGKWEGHGRALPIEGNDYLPEGALTYTFSMSVEQDDVGKVHASGTMKGFNVTQLSLRGELEEGGNILWLTYRNESDELNDYGVGMLECGGTKLSGYFLGRYKELSPRFILGAIEFQKVN
jgi:hypothetical protein